MPYMSTSSPPVTPMRPTRPVAPNAPKRPVTYTHVTQLSMIVRELNF
jgi:hypothetical protein